MYFNHAHENLFFWEFQKYDTVVYKLLKGDGGEILCSVPSILSPNPGRVHFLFLFPTLLYNPSPTWQDAESGLSADNVTHTCANGRRGHEPQRSTLGPGLW